MKSKEWIRDRRHDGQNKDSQERTHWRKRGNFGMKEMSVHEGADLTMEVHKRNTFGAFLSMVKSLTVQRKRMSQELNAEVLEDMLRILYVFQSIN